MRRILLPAAVAVALAIGLVLVLAGGEEDAVVGPESGTVAGSESETEPPKTETEAADEAAPSPNAEVEQAVNLYIEAAEAGGAPAGLPTTDELSIEDVRVQGDRATVELAGGATLSLRKSGDRWQVERARPGKVPRPTPPSNG
jgi:hypothetical protein